MYPEFLASPHLALECLRQEQLMHHRDVERARLALDTVASKPSGLSTWLSCLQSHTVAVLLAAQTQTRAGLDVDIFPLTPAREEERCPNEPSVPPPLRMAHAKRPL